MNAPRTGFFAELKRRKVVRVAVVYAATGFVVLQVADIMLPRLGVPEWAMSLIVLLLILGFPVAVVLASALELLPEGVRVTPATVTSDPSEPRALAAPAMSTCSCGRASVTSRTQSVRRTPHLQGDGPDRAQAARIGGGSRPAPRGPVLPPEVPMLPDAAVFKAPSRVVRSAARGLVPASISLLTALLLGTPAVAAAQGSTHPAAPANTGSSPAGTLQRIVLTNGTVHFGRIIAAGDPVSIELSDGEIVELPAERVARMDEVRGSIENGEFWPADPNGSRLLFTATGRSLPAGGGSFNAYYGLIPFLAIGITDRISLAGGTPLFFGGGDRVVYLAPKVQVVRAERFQAGVGVLALHYTDDDEWDTDANGGAYLAYGVGTFDTSPRSSITVGAGWGRDGGEWSSRPALVVGGDHRASRRAALITENYLFSGGEGLASAGVRFLGERLSADLALATPLGSGETGVFPVVNFSYGW
jgi:hypothetical protein